MNKQVIITFRTYCKKWSLFWRDEKCPFIIIIIIIYWKPEIDCKLLV